MVRTVNFEVLGVAFLFVAALSLSGCEKVLQSPVSPSTVTVPGAGIVAQGPASTVTGFDDDAEDDDDEDDDDEDNDDDDEQPPTGGGGNRAV